MIVSTLSEKELVHRVDMSVNALLTIAELEKAMLEQGITPVKARKGLDLNKEVGIWQQRQEQTQGNALKAQRTLKRVRDSIDAIYRRHRTAARFVYREDEDTLRQLQLKGNKKVRYTDWLDQVQKFYAHMDVEALVPFGILAKEVTEVKKLLGQLSELYVLRNDAKRQAQQATQGKQKAIAELRRWFRLFIRSAELACQDDPQLLEAMGIVVSTK